MIGDSFFLLDNDQQEGYKNNNLWNVPYRDY